MTNVDIRQAVYRPTPNIIGSAPNTKVDAILGNIDQLLGELLEDRNALLSGDGNFTFTGTSLSTSGDLILNLNSLIGGGGPTKIILLSNPGSISFGTSGTLWYVVIDRVGGTATSFTATSLPAVDSANEEVFLIAARLDDTTDSTMRLYFRNGFTMNAGDSVKFASATGSSFNPSTILVDNVTGQVVTSNTFGDVVIEG